jgi:hypothetical protein
MGRALYHRPEGRAIVRGFAAGLSWPTRAIINISAIISPKNVVVLKIGQAKEQELSKKRKTLYLALFLGPVVKLNYVRRVALSTEQNDFENESIACGPDSLG